MAATDSYDDGDLRADRGKLSPRHRFDDFFFCPFQYLVVAPLVWFIPRFLVHVLTLLSSQGYLYVTIVYNISISVALMALVFFYTATQDLLVPYKPVLKFLTVKSVVFVSYWQSVILAILVKMNVISPVSESQV